MSAGSRDINMTVLAHTTVDPTTISKAPGPGVERTLTGIPVTLIWLPYVGFSAVLIALMALSFFQYHRKHGHKYHHAKDELFDTITLDGISNQEQGRSVSVDKLNVDKSRGDSLQPRDRHKGQSAAAQRSDKRSQHVSHKAPPNGGVPSAQKHKYYGDDDIAASEHLMQSSETVQSTSKPKHGYSSSSSKPIAARSRDVSKPHCDEPSTSSSTVSSKNSSNTSKTNRSRPPRRHRHKLNFESNQNGSMVDVRIPEDDFETFTPAKPREREKLSRPVSKPTATEQSMGLFRGYSDPATSEDTTKKPYTPDITDRIYRGNYVQSGGSNSAQSLQQTSQTSRRGHSFNAHDPQKAKSHLKDRVSDYDRNDRAGSLPIWTTLPLQEKPAAQPKPDYYSYPFTPSGHMQMLSDTEDDEVFLLKHTKL